MSEEEKQEFIAFHIAAIDSLDAQDLVEIMRLLITYRYPSIEALCN